MQTKFIVLGILTGIVIGFIVPFIFPKLFVEGLKLNILFNKGLNYPADFYSLTGGSIFNVLSIFPLFSGLVGGIVGLILYKTTHINPRIRERC